MQASSERFMELCRTGRLTYVKSYINRYKPSKNIINIGLYQSLNNFRYGIFNYLLGLINNNQEELYNILHKIQSSYVMCDLVVKSISRGYTNMLSLDYFYIFYHFDHILKDVLRQLVSKSDYNGIRIMMEYMFTKSIDKKHLSGVYKLALSRSDPEIIKILFEDVELKVLKYMDKVYKREDIKPNKNQNKLLTYAILVSNFNGEEPPNIPDEVLRLAFSRQKSARK